MMTRCQADEQFEPVLSQARRYRQQMPQAYDSWPAYHRIKGDLLAMRHRYQEELRTNSDDGEARARLREVLSHLPSPHDRSIVLEMLEAETGAEAR